MFGFVVVLYFLFQLLWRLYVGMEILWFGKNLITFMIMRWQKKEKIQEMHAFPEGVLYQARNKSSDEAFKSIAALLAFWENPYADQFPCLVGRCMHEQIKRSKKTMKLHSVYRKLRFIDVNVQSGKNGKIYRNWSNSDKEWRYCYIDAIVLEQYCEIKTNRVIKEKYYPKMAITYLMSRRLSPDDKKRARSVDKWGRIREIKSFYHDKGLTNYPSCGAELSRDIKDIVCPYCGSTIFADFYDWQVELLAINKGRNPFACIAYLVWFLFAYNPVETLVGGKSKKGNQRDKRIVRFSENDFLCNVYEDLFDRIPEDTFIDLNVGDMRVRKVRNTEEDNYVTLKIPVQRAYFTENGSIRTDKEKQIITYRRKRYPNRFQAKDAVAFKEKQCPACGGAFSPDEQGNCTFCGNFLLLDNTKWIRDEVR